MVTSSQCLDPDSPTHMTVCMGRSCYVHVMLTIAIVVCIYSAGYRYIVMGSFKSVDLPG